MTVPDHVLVQEIDGQAALLHLHDEVYFSLDATGTRMWTALREEGGIAAAVDRLLAIYYVDAGRLRADVEALVARLAEHGLIVRG